jgi:hypothetical protein
MSASSPNVIRKYLPAAPFGDRIVSMKQISLIVRMAYSVAALFVPALAYAQGCALCYTQAAGLGSRMIAALRSGILILAIPPVLICGGITWMAYKKRDHFNDDRSNDVPGIDPEI